MSMAIKYAMQKKAKGGSVAMCAHGSTNCEMCHGGKMYAEGDEVDASPSPSPSPTPTPKPKRPPNLDPKKRKEFMDSFMGFSEGGAVHEDDRMLNQHGALEVGAEGTMDDNEAPEMHNYAHNVENQDDHEDMVGHIMKKRQMHFSKGGRVANDVGTGEEADAMPNQFDDLVKDDGLEEHYTGKNSGDEVGDAAEDEDRRDIVAMIMKSRKKKDRLPNPR